AQIRITGTGLVEERRPLARFTFDDRLKKLFNLVPTFRRHAITDCGLPIDQSKNPRIHLLIWSMRQGGNQCALRVGASVRACSGGRLPERMKTAGLVCLTTASMLDSWQA